MLNFPVASNIIKIFSRLLCDKILAGKQKEMSIKTNFIKGQNVLKTEIKRKRTQAPATNKS